MRLYHKTRKGFNQSGKKFHYNVTMLQCYNVLNTSYQGFLFIKVGKIKVLRLEIKKCRNL